MKSLLIGSLITLTLTSTATAQTDCYPIAPSGEGFPRIQCLDGVWYQDMDGQPYENAAGYPVYEPGTWVRELGR